MLSPLSAAMDSSDLGPRLIHYSLDPYELAPVTTSRLVQHWCVHHTYINTQTMLRMKSVAVGHPVCTACMRCDQKDVSVICNEFVYVCVWHLCPFLRFGVALKSRYSSRVLNLSY